jgi:dTDP-4-amino-4,6-dideoxygalactose transaminase
LIPFLDLRRLHASIAGELEAAFRRVLDANQLILGSEVAAFEEEFAAYCGASHCIGVSSGLEAMSLALRAAGVGPGDEVIVPAHTYIATWLAVSQLGARPTPVEVRLDTGLLRPDAVEAALTPRTAAILPVHLYGQAAEMQPLLQLAAKRGLFVLEDAAQAHGAREGGKRCGALGHAAAFSFYPSKNLGALGDGGAVVTDDAGLAARLRRLRNYGAVQRDVHEVLGSNARLDELQAAFLRVKLRSLDAWNRARAERAALYFESLASVGGELALPVVAPGNQHAWHLFTVRSRRRAELMSALAADGVESRIHYPTPPHLQPAYAGLGFARGAFEAAEEIADTVFSLPIDPLMSEGDVRRVCATLRRCLGAPASEASR